jgi:hypothetical protein
MWSGGLKQPTALPEQHRHPLQLHLIQQAGTKARLRNRGAVQQDVAATWPQPWPARRRIRAQPVVQPLSVDAESVIHSIVRAGDEPIVRHRHVEQDLGH